MIEYQHFIGGRHQAEAARQGDVFNPSLGEVTARVALASAAEVDQAVQAAAAAQPQWAATNPQRRARVMFRFKTLVEDHADELARLPLGHGLDRAPAA